MRNKGRLYAVPDPGNISRNLPGIELLRSENWARDRDMEDLLGDYNLTEVDILIKLLKHNFPGSATIMKLKIAPGKEEPTAEGLLTDAVDHYADSLEQYDPDENFMVVPANIAAMKVQPPQEEDDEDEDMEEEEEEE